MIADIIKGYYGILAESLKFYVFKFQLVFFKTGNNYRLFHDGLFYISYVSLVNLVCTFFELNYLSFPPFKLMIFFYLSIFNIRLILLQKILELNLILLQKILEFNLNTYELKSFLSRWVNVPQTPVNDPFQRALVTLATSPTSAMTISVTASSGVAGGIASPRISSKTGLAAGGLSQPAAVSQHSDGSSSYAESMARVDQWLMNNSASEASVAVPPATPSLQRSDPVALTSVGGVLKVSKQDIVKGVNLKGVVGSPPRDGSYNPLSGDVAASVIASTTGEPKRKAPKPPNQKKISNSSKSKKR